MSFSSQPTTLFTTTRTSSTATASQLPNTYNVTGDGGQENVGTDTAAGASGGDSSSFHIDQGALIAIVVVCGLVVIIGGNVVPA